MRPDARLFITRTPFNLPALCPAKDEISNERNRHMFRVSFERIDEAGLEERHRMREPNADVRYVFKPKIG